MADIHIVDFHRDSAAILLQLFRSFPRKIQLYVEDIAGPTEPDEFGLPSPRHQACFATMIWLAEAGYLTYLTNIGQEALDQVTLSHLGYTLLSSPINMAHEDQTATNHIQSLRTALKSGSTTQIEQCVLRLFEQSQRFR